MSETYPFHSEEADGMSKREQLEEYFSQSLEVDTLLRLCPDDEDTISNNSTTRCKTLNSIPNTSKTSISTSWIVAFRQTP